MMVRMSKVVVVFAAATAMVSFCGPALAAKPADSETKGAVAAPAPKPSKFALPHHVTGDLVVMDPGGKTLTVKDSKGREFRLSASGDAALSLGNFHPGDHVKVTYKKSRGQMIASKIATAPATSMKK